jgi:neutral ceramidase
VAPRPFIAGALVALALGAALPGAASGSEARTTAAPAARLTVLTSSETVLRNRGRLKVRVHYGALGRVRVMVRVRGGAKRWGTRLMKARLLSFRGSGTRNVSLRLTRYGRSVLRGRARGCAARLRFVVLGRARHYRRLPGRPLFSPHGKGRSSRWVKRVRRLSRPACPTSSKPTAAGSLGGPGAAGGAGSGGPTRAGAASADITPPVGTPMFAYTARSNVADPPTSQEQFLALAGGDKAPDSNLYAKSFEPSQGIHTRVRARAIVIEQGGKKYALVQTDLGGLPFALTQEVLSRVAGTGVTGERLLLSATHTHSSTGPIWPADSMGYGALGGDFFDPRIFNLTAEGIAEAIRAANARLEPAKIGAGSAQLTDASRNREFDVFKLDPETPSDPAAAKEASIDPTVNVIRVDALDGRPLAVWSNFAIHPTSFGDDNLLFSGDNAASAERIVESETGGAINVWTNSNEGDISPHGEADKEGSDALQYTPNAFAEANLAGQRTARGIMAAWRDAAGHMDANPQIEARRTIFAFDGVTQADDGVTPANTRPVGPQPVLGLGVITEGQCNPVGDPGDAQGKKQFLAGGPLVPNTAPVSIWRIGSFGVAAFPTEITKTQGARIKNRLLADAGGRISRFALAGLTNSYLSYTATPQEYDACSYEGSFTLFGRHQGSRYRDVATNVLAALLGGTEPSSLPEPPSTGFSATQPVAAQTPDAGQVSAQPAASARRYGRAVFKWKAGDPAVDPQRGGTFVALQHQVGSGWQTVGTDDGYLDTTRYDKGAKEWTETWQFGACDPLGSYRFHVTGMADKDGSGAKPYTVDSQPFTLEKTPPLTFDPPSVAGGSASVVARYPDPGADVLVALDRRVRSGKATLSVNGSPVEAQPDSDRLRFTAPVPAGASVSVTAVEDACGNSGP